MQSYVLRSVCASTDHRHKVRGLLKQFVFPSNDYAFLTNMSLEKKKSISHITLVTLTLCIGKKSVLRSRFIVINLIYSDKMKNNKKIPEIKIMENNHVFVL